MAAVLSPSDAPTFGESFSESSQAQAMCPRCGNAFICRRCGQRRDEVSSPSCAAADRQAKGRHVDSRAWSPKLSKDRSQVLETLGSLQQALNRSETSLFQDDSIRNEADVLWRENRELRREVQTWREEASARQRETAELRLAAAQMQAELAAERTRSQKLAAQLEVLSSRQAKRTSPRSVTVREGNPSSSSSSFCRASSPLRGRGDLLQPAGARPLSAAAGNLDADWLRAKRLCSAAWSAEPPALPHKRHSGGSQSPPPRQSLTPPRRPGPGAHALSPGRCSPRTEWCLASNADDMATVNSRHASEVANLHMEHRTAMDALRGQADVALGRARLAEVRCVRLEKSQARIAETCGRLVEFHRTASAFAAWRQAWIRARAAWSSKQGRLAQALLHASATQWSLERKVETNLHLRLCMEAWSADAALTGLERRRRALEARVLRSDDVRYSQLSWLLRRASCTDLEVSQLECFSAWYFLVAGRLREELRLREVQGSALAETHDELCRRASVQALLHVVLSSWLTQALVQRIGCVRDASFSSMARGLTERQRCSLGWRRRCFAAEEAAVLLRALLSLRTAARERVREAKLRALAAEQLAELVDCANQRTLHAVLGAIDGDALAVQRCALVSWVAACELARTDRGFEAAEGQISRVRGQAELEQLRLVGLYWRREVLRRSLLCWLRCVRSVYAEKQILAGRERMSQLRASFLESAARQVLKANQWLSVSRCWQAWCQESFLSSRHKVESEVWVHAEQRLQQMNRVQLLAVGASSQVQQEFLLRACFAAWRRLQSLQRASSDRDNLGKLLAAVARMQYARDVSIRRLARSKEDCIICAWVVLAWIIWRRLRMEAAMIEEFEAVKSLLAQLQAEWDRQQLLHSQQEWADQNAYQRMLRQQQLEQELQFSQLQQASGEAMEAQTSLVSLPIAFVGGQMGGRAMAGSCSNSMASNAPSRPCTASSTRGAHEREIVHNSSCKINSAERPGLWRLPPPQQSCADFV
eukprot:TRINITY_DN87698_c0_g1_i1.p1 TRINITY_DN87698_c0_g1~~TRINITY_DN87698_c0_g1_i1.p1  ORF type:complete len:994 (-),score=181.09 TRINITY_DN87698_c0_g1_i1:115-3096(-)